MLDMQTTSSIRSYRRCNRLYQYMYVDGVRPAKTPPVFLVGSAFHYATELFWHGANEQGILEGLDTYFSTEPYWSTEKGRYQVSKVKAMALGYLDKWSKEKEEYNVVAVEKQVDFTLCDGVRIAGKFDALLKEKTSDKHWLIETKTVDFDVSDAGAAYWERLAFDMQVTLYTHPLRAVFGEIGIIFDVARKPRHRPKSSKGRTTESPNEFFKRVRQEIKTNLGSYFARHNVHRTRKQNLAIIDETIATVKQMSSCETFPRNESACVRMGGGCGFLGVCAGTDRLDSENFNTIDDPHPELKK